MSCTINALASPGQPSSMSEVLFDIAKKEILEGKHKHTEVVSKSEDQSIEGRAEALAEFWYSLTTHEKFIQSFGDWKNDYGSESSTNTTDYSGRIDTETGDPLLVLNPRYNKYEYTGKYGEKVRFPPSIDSLENIGNKKIIRNIAKTMAYKILKPRFFYY